MAELDINNINIRVYGLIINDNHQILLSDEYQLGMNMTKFPGGGLNFGEGTIDCIKREAIEEFGQAVEIVSHFYTTDFYQKSFFFKSTQLISVYYIVRFKDEIKFKISDKPFDFAELVNGNQSFRWKNIKDLSQDDFTLPIDKIVAKMLYHLEK